MARFVVYQDAAHEFRWRFVADNGRVMADSGEGYTRRDDAHEALHRLLELIREMDRTADPSI